MRTVIEWAAARMMHRMVTLDTSSGIVIAGAVMGLISIAFAISGMLSYRKAEEKLEEARRYYDAGKADPPGPENGSPR